jgi:hypothetical protein
VQKEWLGRSLTKNGFQQSCSESKINTESADASLCKASPIVQNQLLATLRNGQLTPRALNFSLETTRVSTAKQAFPCPLDPLLFNRHCCETFLPVWVSTLEPGHKSIKTHKIVQV